MQESLSPHWMGLLPQRMRKLTVGDRVFRKFIRSRRSGMTLLLALIAVIPKLAPAQGRTGCVPNSLNYPCVYVVNSSGSSVSAINASSNQVIATIPVGSSPEGLAITPDNSFVYVADTHTNDSGLLVGTVSVIDTRTNLVSAVVSGLRGFPLQIAIAPGGTFAYVTGSGANLGFVDVVDTASKQVIPGGRTGFTNPTAVAFTPSGAFAYVADTCGNLACVDVIDTSTHQLIGSVSIPGTVASSVASLAITPDGSLVCLSVVTNANSPDVQVAFISTSNNTFLNLLKIENNGSISNHGFGITATDVLYAAEQPAAQIQPAVVLPIAVSSQTIGNRIQIGTGVETSPSLAVGPNGAWVYATNPNENTVSVISTATNSVTSTVTLAAESFPQDVASMSLNPPTITTQPASLTISFGLSATLSVVATNIAPLSYQWFQGQSGDVSTPIAGANGASFTTPALSLATSYWVQVSNLAGSVDSATAIVTVNQPPTCSLATQGSAPSNPFTITAIVNCIDPQLSPLTTTIGWGDNSSTTTDGGSVTVTHTYAQDGIYQIIVTSTDSFQLQGQVPALVNLLAIANPLPIFPGQTSVVPVVILGAPPNLKVTFECTTVTDSNGTVRQAVDFGITCSSNPAPVTLTGARQPVDILLHTTGAAIGSIAPGMRPRKLLYALLLPLPSLVVWVLGIGTLRNRRVSVRGVGLSTALAIGILLTSCGGGFTAPGTQGATPPGNYRVTVIDRPVEGQSLTGFVQTSLIVPLSVM